MTFEERVSALFDAMENHGNDQGTETQLGDAEQFLRACFDLLPDERKEEFLNSKDVVEFVEREG